MNDIEQHKEKLFYDVAEFLIENTRCNIVDILNISKTIVDCDETYEHEPGEEPEEELPDYN